MKKGFTLVEVIAIVAILAIITVLVVPKVKNTIEKNKRKVCEGIKKTIEDSAKSYTYLHISEVDNAILSSGYKEITLKKLIEEDLLTSELEDPYTKEAISKENTVRITKSGNSYEFTYMGDDCK